MPTVLQIAEDIVAREGGYVNDPDDPGGATNFGVTLATLLHLGLDVTRDERVGMADVRALTRTQAVDIFIEHHFTAPQISDLPVLLQPSVFDMYVNAGSNAVKILQRLLKDMSYEVSVDGVIGPQTAAAAQTAGVVDVVALKDAYGIARRNYYFRLADRRVASRKYARTRAGGKGGWIKRAEEFLSPHYHLSDQAFCARVAAWG
mgnify:CR=1 FL=1